MFGIYYDPSFRIISIAAATDATAMRVFSSLTVDSMLTAYLSAVVKNSFATLAWRFSAHRMVADYVRLAYLPAAGGISAKMPR